MLGGRTGIFGHRLQSRTLVQSRLCDAGSGRRLEGNRNLNKVRRKGARRDRIIPSWLVIWTAVFRLCKEDRLERSCLKISPKTGLRRF